MIKKERGWSQKEDVVREREREGEREGEEGEVFQ
jgi:hypothetical protein